MAPKVKDPLVIETLFVMVFRLHKKEESGLQLHGGGLSNREASSKKTLRKITGALKIAG
jgi:hypothetical protein